MCCSKTFNKFFLIFFNILFFLLGAVALGLGIWVAVDKSSVMSVLSRVPGDASLTADEINNVIKDASWLQMAAYITIALGSVMVILGFCGCCGALKEVKCLLYFYATVLIVLLIIQIAAVVLAFIFRGKIKERLNVWLESTIYNKYQGSTLDSKGKIVVSTEQFTQAWDLAMVGMKCCGANNNLDFNKTTVWSKTYTYNGKTINAVVPPTCCKMTNPGKFPGSTSQITFTDLENCLRYAYPNATNTGGCYDALVGRIEQYAWVIAGVGIAILILEILGIICSCCLINMLTKENDFV